METQSKPDTMNQEWKLITDPPKVGGEYNVVWELSDGGKPTVTSMDFDAIKNVWTDPRGIGDDVTSELLYWCELPEPPTINQ